MSYQRISNITRNKAHIITSSLTIGLYTTSDMAISHENYTTILCFPQLQETIVFAAKSCGAKIL